MRICILTTSYPDVLEPTRGIFIKEILDCLKKDSNFQIDIQTSLSGFPKLTQGSGGLAANLGSSWLARFLLIPFFIVYFLKSFSAAKKSDVIHAFWAGCGFQGVFYKYLFRKPLLMTEYGATFNLAAKYKLLYYIYMFVLKKCDIIATNNTTQTEKIKKLGFDNVYTVADGLNLQTFRKTPKKKAREKLNIPLERFIYLYTGSLIPRKAVSDLIKAFRNIASSHNNVELVIIGTGILEKELKHLAKNLGISEKVTFTGRKLQDDISLYMCAADIFVLPSYSEGRPEVVSEALYSATPVIGSNIGGTNELVKHGFNGLLYEPGDIKALEKCLNSVLEDKILLQHLTDGASKFDFLTWDKTADMYKELYKMLHFSSNLINSS